MLNNTIKRKSNTLKVKTKIDLNGGAIPKGSEIIIKKELGFGWFGGGYMWPIAHIRNGNILEILEQV